MLGTKNNGNTCPATTEGACFRPADSALTRPIEDETQERPMKALKINRWFIMSLFPFLPGDDGVAPVRL